MPDNVSMLILYGMSFLFVLAFLYLVLRFTKD
jgi:hypothetical protein